MVTSKLVSRERCPQCAEAGRDISEDNLGIFDDGHSYCFSCEYYYNPQGKDPTDIMGFTYEYLPWRNITKETFKRYSVLTKINGEGKPISVGFRYPNGDLKIRPLAKKEFFWIKGGSNEPSGLFGQDKFTPGTYKYVTITEGEVDALSLHQVLGSPVVSVQSSVTALRDCTNSRSWLNSFERIYLGMPMNISKPVKARHLNGYGGTRRSIYQRMLYRLYRTLRRLSLVLQKWAHRIHSLSLHARPTG